LKWLNNDANGPWLFVLDNADSIENFFGSSSHTSSGETRQLPMVLVNYLPQSSKGAMIITTRDRRIGAGLVGRENPIAVLPFGMEDAKCLLQKTLGDDEIKDEESMALLEALDFLPLAITQAASFIRENGISLVDYLELLRDSDKKTKDLLSENHHDPGRDLEIRNSVFQTWKISFDRIRKQKPLAADILSLMAVLDRQAIQAKLVCRDVKRSVDFVTAIGTLKAFSLITEEKGAATFGMHRLVQLSLQRWLELQGVIEEWQEKALTAVSECCPRDGTYKNWIAWETINPHVHVVLGFVFNTDSCLLQRASILSRAANYDMEQGRYEAAHRKATEALAIRERGLGTEHPVTLASLTSLAWVLIRQGEFEAAEKISRRALGVNEKVLGPEHPDTLSSVNSLAFALMRQGKYKVAEKMSRQALAGREKVHGREHLDTLSSVCYLASVLEMQGKYEDAEKMNQRALDGRERALGPEHPDTLMSVSNLASVLERQGKYEEAENMCRRVLNGMEKALGLEHPNTLAGVSDLAWLLMRRGKYEAAEKMSQRVLDSSEKTLGPEHPLTVSSISELASVLERKGKYEAAEKMHQEALHRREKTLGPEHPSTLASVTNLASVLLKQERYKEAEEMNQRAVNVSEKALGPDHPLTLTSVNDLAWVLTRQGKYVVAEEMSRRALDGREKVLGPEHPMTLTSVYCLGYLLQNQKQYNEASILYQRACSGYQKTLGLDHPTTLACSKQYLSLLEELKRN
jgi:tetratricopeptide (TPR) repeat protein